MSRKASKYRVGDKVYLHCSNAYDDPSALFGYSVIELIHKGTIVKVDGEFYIVDMGEPPFEGIENWHHRVVKEEEIGLALSTSILRAILIASSRLLKKLGGRR